jgi:transcriptional regulator GlxA family with amidase domain
MNNSVFQPAKAPLSIGLLLFENANMLTLAALIDPLRAANQRAGQRNYQWQFYSFEGGPIRLTSGVDILCSALPAHPDFDMLCVIAGAQTEAQSTPQMLTILRALSSQIPAIAGIEGGGGWPLARAALLDDACAAVHPEGKQDFINRFPHVAVTDAPFTVSGPYVTAGGAVQGLELMCI